jgi:hypothetical protein
MYEAMKRAYLAALPAKPPGLAIAEIPVLGLKGVG